MSDLSEPSRVSQIVAGPYPVEITDHGEVVHVISGKSRGITAEEMIAFWESGGGIDRKMLDEIDAMFCDTDEYTEHGSEHGSEDPR